jgi:DnaK suppressor protein
MNSTQARALLEKELTRLNELRGAASNLAEQAAQSEATELSRADQHPSDVATELGERERVQAAEGLVEADLREVHAALERLEAGTYGTCERCGRPIADARLEAMPAARHCIECRSLINAGKA